MPGRDGVRLSPSREHAAHIHDAVDPVVIIDLHRILIGGEGQRLGGIKHDDGQRAFR